MHTSPSLTHQDEQPVDPWAFLAGGSVGIVIGFGVDLWRLGVHEAKRALAARSRNQPVATRGWRCPGNCEASAR